MESEQKWHRSVRDQGFQEVGMPSSSSLCQLNACDADGGWATKCKKTGSQYCHVEESQLPPGTSTCSVRWMINEFLFCFELLSLWDQSVTVAWPSLIVLSLKHSRCCMNVSSSSLNYAHNYAQLPSLLYLLCVQCSLRLFACTVSFLTTVLLGRYYHLNFIDAESATLGGEVMCSRWPD